MPSKAYHPGFWRDIHQREAIGEAVSGEGNEGILCTARDTRCGGDKRELGDHCPSAGDADDPNRLCEHGRSPSASSHGSTDRVGTSPASPTWRLRWEASGLSCFRRSRQGSNGLGLCSNSTRSPHRFTWPHLTAGRFQQLHRNGSVSAHGGRAVRKSDQGHDMCRAM